MQQARTLAPRPAWQAGGPACGGQDNDDAAAVIERERLKLGRALKARRRQRDLTQLALAALIGYSRSHVAGAENGRHLNAAEFWEAAEGVLGGDLAAWRNKVAAMSTARADKLVSAGRRRPGGRMASGAAPGRGLAPITAARQCPNCRAELIVETIVGAAIESNPGQGASLIAI